MNIKTLLTKTLRLAHNIFYRIYKEEVVTDKTNKNESNPVPEFIKEDYVAATEIISTAFGCCADNELGVDEVHHAFLLSILGVIYYQLNNKEEADSFVSNVQKLIWNIHNGMDEDFIGEAEIQADAIAELFGMNKTIH